MCSIIVDEILNHLKQLGQAEQYKLQSQLAMDLFLRLVLRSDVSQSSTANLATNLWQLCQRNPQTDTKLAVSYIYSQ